MMDKRVSEAPEAVVMLAQAQVSFRSRVGHLALLLVAIGATVSLTSLLATEEGLPLRTWAGLLALLMINVGWGSYAAWVLAVRRTMLSNHRVVAGRIALGASTLFALSAAALGIVTGAAAAYLAAGIGLALLIVAAIVLSRAKQNLRTLQRRRTELETRLLEIGQ